MAKKAFLGLLVAFLAALSDAAAAQGVRAIPCADCHEEVLRGFLTTRHAAALSVDLGTATAGLCSPCHGEGMAHNSADRPAKVPVEYRFKEPNARPVTEVNARCLSCHSEGLKALPAMGVHLRAGLACTTCHTGMGRGGLPLLLKRPERELCGGCHAQAIAPGRSGHHPDASGALCTFCHDPHSERRPLIARDCTDCHRSLAFPKAFEHPAAEQGCVGCHAPHGSGERFLLKESRPALCLSCHSQMETFHRIDDAASPFQLYEACQNCHPRIHGSDARGGYRFQR